MELTGIFLIVMAVVLVALIVLVVILFSKIKQQKERMDRFMMGTDGEDLEAALYDRFTRIDELEEHTVVNEKCIKDIYKRLQGTYQKLGVSKYNAFTENGGNLSFALALLNEKDSGYIMNVMNSREGSYVYVKEVTLGKSEIQLGDEEEKALAQAMSQRGRNVRH